MNALNIKDPHLLLCYLQLSAKDSVMEKRDVWLQEQDLLKSQPRCLESISLLVTIAFGQYQVDMLHN